MKIVTIKPIPGLELSGVCISELPTGNQIVYCQNRLVVYNPSKELFIETLASFCIIQEADILLNNDDE